MLELMGRGSVLGMNNVLHGEVWVYNGTAVSVISTSVIEITCETINSIADMYQDLNKSVDRCKY